MIPKIKFVIVLASIFSFQTISSQSSELLGKVQSKLDVENININHVSYNLRNDRND